MLLEKQIHSSFLPRCQLAGMSVNQSTSPRCCPAAFDRYNDVANNGTTATDKGGHTRPVLAWVLNVLPVV